jgi:hypothetical protein
MILPEEFAHLAREKIIVVDNANRPTCSATEASVQHPVLCRYQKPLMREKRMIRKRLSQMSNRWESAPLKPSIPEYSLKYQGSTSCSSCSTMHLVHLAAAMPLRMPVRSSDDCDLQQSRPSICGEQQSLIGLIDEALAISETMHVHS